MNKAFMYFQQSSMFYVLKPKAIKRSFSLFSAGFLMSLCLRCLSGIYVFICPHLSASACVFLFVSGRILMCVVLRHAICTFICNQCWGFRVVFLSYCLLEQIEGVTLSCVDTIFSDVIKRIDFIQIKPEVAVSQIHA